MGIHFYWPRLILDIPIYNPHAYVLASVRGPGINYQSIQITSVQPFYAKQKLCKQFTKNAIHILSTSYQWVIQSLKAYEPINGSIINY